MINPLFGLFLSVLFVVLVLAMSFFVKLIAIILGFVLSALAVIVIAAAIVLILAAIFLSCL